jgi:hypothetical protein
VAKKHEGWEDRAHTFDDVWERLNAAGSQRLTTKAGTAFVAKAAITARGKRKGERVIRYFQHGQEYGRCYPCCWEHYHNCNRTRIGMYSRAVDQWIQPNASGRRHSREARPAPGTAIPDERLRPSRGCSLSKHDVEISILGGVISALVSLAIVQISPVVVVAAKYTLTASLGFVGQARDVLTAFARVAMIIGAVAGAAFAITLVWRWWKRQLEKWPAREVAVDPRRRISSGYASLLFSWLRRVAQVVTRSRLVLTYIVLAIVGPFVPPLLYFFLVLTVVWITLRDFYAVSSATRETAEILVSELLLTLGRGVEELMREALARRDFRIRCQIMLLEPETGTLRLRYAYHMAGEPDFDLSLRPGQGVQGRVIAQATPLLASPYDPKSLGLSASQIETLPWISWVAAFPLRSAVDGEVIGVLGIDCDRSVPMEWLDKMLDHVRSTADAIALVGSLIWPRR